MVKKRRFVCNRYKSYAVRNHKFEDGLLEVDVEDVDTIKLIESADGYGVFIHPAETPEELEALKPKTKPRVAVTVEHDPPLAHQGARGTNAGKGQRQGDLTVKGKDK